MNPILRTTSLRARLKNQIHCRSRREEAQIFGPFGQESEPPHVASYNFKTAGLAVAGGLLRETVPLAQRFSDDRLVGAPAGHQGRRASGRNGVPFSAFQALIADRTRRPRRSGSVCQSRAGFAVREVDQVEAAVARRQTAGLRARSDLGWRSVASFG